jgi:hypothetical protein
VDALAEVADGLGRLLSEHALLAKAELARDARVYGVQLGKVAVFAPLAVVGYALVCGAAALALARWMGLVGALALVGGVNLVVGAVGLALVARRLEQQEPLQQTLREVQRSATVLAPALNGKAHGA